MSTNNIHVMVDLETWSTKPNAIIISIGAVKFDNHSDQILDRFHVGIDPTRFPHKPFDVDPQTIAWWIDPERDEARRRWIGLQKVDLPTALIGFAEWLGTDRMPVWGNGAAFDNVLLATSYELCGLVRPWDFRDDRCYRTVKNMVPGILFPETPPELAGVAHDALYDATMQAMHLQTIFSILRPVP